MEKKTILVTGGAGFIGSNLIEELVRNPSNKVVCLDNYFTGKKENHIAGATYLEGHTKDVGEHVSVRPDLVYHLGEYARVEQSFDDVERVFEYNTVGTIAVLEFCRKHGAKIVYAGSSTKFGDGGLGINQSPYAWTKAANSELVKNYGTWFGVPYAITYFYNVYGPREIAEGNYATVIAAFAKRHRDGKPLPVTSPGTQVRNFTHVKDIVRGLQLVAEKGEGDEYGLGALKGYSILEIAKLFGGEIEMLPPRQGTRMNSSLDTASAEALGWRAEHDVADYVKEIVAGRVS